MKELVILLLSKLSLEELKTILEYATDYDDNEGLSKETCEELMKITKAIHISAHS